MKDKGRTKMSNMQWLQNAKVRVISTQISREIVIEFAYPFFAHSSHSIPSSVTFQTNLILKLTLALEELGFN